MALFNKTDKVCIPLREKIHSGQYPDGSRLPSFRELSKALHVSAGTIDAGLGILEKEGLVERRKRSGVYVRSPHKGLPTWESEPASGRQAAQEIADDLIKGISTGRYKAGDFLPLRKTMRFQYRTSAQTLNKALQTVEARHFIHKKGTAYIVGMDLPRQSATRPQAVLILPRTASGRTRYRVTLFPGFLKAFEDELENNGVSFAGRYNKAPFAIGDQNRQSRDILGGLYPVSGNWWMTNSRGNNTAHVDREIRRLNEADFPIVIFNAINITDRFPNYSFKEHKRLFPFGIEDTQVGRAVGISLAQMGHQSIGYFSYSSEPWNVQRCIGLERGMTNVLGQGAAVVPFQAGFDRMTIRELRERHTRILHRSLKEMTKSVLNGFRFSKIDPKPAILSEFYKQIRTEHEMTTMTPLFEQALKNKELSTWVCSDETVTLAAMIFLKEKGIHLPQQLSLLGIDGHVELANQGIASYQLQFDRMGYLAAHCILGDIPIRKDKRGIVECPGRLVERGTLRRV